MKLKGLSQEQTDKIIPKNLVLCAYRGSIAHGMYVPNTDPDSVDDKDIMGVFMGSDKHYLGFGERETREHFVNEWDCVFYEFRMFANLLMKSNPNVLSMLWVRENHILYQNEIGKRLRENRELFVSKQAYHSFTGYAYSQLKRMTHFKFEGYMGEKRKQLVLRHGWDCKNGSHLLRLLNMGIEFLTDGELHVHREDAQYLLDIKHGKYTLDQVKDEADKLFKLAKQAYINSRLPDKPDRNKIERFVVDTVMEYLVK
jgi:predicted nucleotidyltransferase